MELSEEGFQAIDKNGNTVPARAIICSECGAKEFRIFVLAGRHQHVECLKCSTSFCDGTCSREPNPYKPRAE